MTENMVIAICAAIGVCIFFGGLFWLTNRREEREHEHFFFSQTGKIPKRYLK